MDTVTIVIPCYNEAYRLPGFLNDLCREFQALSHIDLLIVDDGSEAEHFRAIEQCVGTMRSTYGVPIELVRQPVNGGKGAALATGFERAHTDIVGFIDADGSISASECRRLVEFFLRAPSDLGGMIGSRVKMLGRRVERKLSRHLVGRVFATILSNLFDLEVYDSQCGCKFFRRSQVLPLLPHVDSRQWLWDTQLLVLCLTCGVTIVEEPISWKETPGSKVSVLSDSVMMFLGLLKFKRKLATTRLAR